MLQKFSGSGSDSNYSDVTLLFQHSPSRASEKEHFEILFVREKINTLDDFSCNLICYRSFSFHNVGSALCIYIGM